MGLLIKMLLRIEDTASFLFVFYIAFPLYLIYTFICTFLYISIFKAKIYSLTSFLKDLVLDLVWQKIANAIIPLFIDGPCSRFTHGAWSNGIDDT